MENSTENKYAEIIIKLETERVSKRKGRKFGKVCPIKNGDIFTMKSGRTCKVYNYINARNIHIVFDDGFTDNVCYSTLRKGSYCHPLDRTIYGVGYLGVGCYSPSKDRVAHNKWVGVLERCYSSRFHKKKEGSRYKGTLLVEEWNNFQNFAKWFYDQYYEAGWQIDKDLFSDKVSMYSPTTCVLVPADINMATIQDKGVYFWADAKRLKKYQVNISHRNIKKTVGYALTEEEGMMMYKIAKRDYLKRVIIENNLPSELEHKLLERVNAKFVC